MKVIVRVEGIPPARYGKAPRKRHTEQPLISALLQTNRRALVADADMREIRRVMARIYRRRGSWSAHAWEVSTRSGIETVRLWVRHEAGCWCGAAGVVRDGELPEGFSWGDPPRCRDQPRQLRRLPEFEKFKDEIRRRIDQVLVCGGRPVLVAAVRGPVESALKRWLTWPGFVPGHRIRVAVRQASCGDVMIYAWHACDGRVDV